MGKTAPSLTALLLIPLVAGCLEVGDPATDPTEAAHTGPSEITRLTDVRGDARIYTAAGAVGYVTAAGCDVVPAPAREPCAASARAVHDRIGPILEGADSQGQYEAALDVLAVSLEETPESLLVRIEVASLDPSFSGIADDKELNAGWKTCWAVAAGSSKDWSGFDRTECVYMEVDGLAGFPQAKATFERDTGRCNDWHWCAWNVPYQFSFGGPATIQLAVPRALMESGDFRDNLTNVRAGSFWTRWPGGGAVRGELEVGVAVGGVYADEAGSEVGYGIGWGRMADVTPTPGGTFTFRSLASAAPTSAGSCLFEDEAGDAGRPDLDVRCLRLLEDGQNVTLSMEVARIENPSEDHAYWIMFGMPSGLVHQAGYRLTDGRLEPYSGVCSDQHCTRWEAFGVTFDITPGRPGWVNLTMARAEIDAPMRGQVTNSILASLWQEAASYSLSPAATPLSASIDYTARPWEQVGSASPYWFQLDTGRTST